MHTQSSYDTSPFILRSHLLMEILKTVAFTIDIGKQGSHEVGEVIANMLIFFCEWFVSMMVSRSRWLFPMINMHDDIIAYVALLLRRSSLEISCSTIKPNRQAALTSGLRPHNKHPQSSQRMAVNSISTGLSPVSRFFCGCMVSATLILFVYRERPVVLDKITKGVRPIGQLVLSPMITQDRTPEVRTYFRWIF
jgi:hypothetical protein